MNSSDDYDFKGKSLAADDDFTFPEPFKKKASPFQEMVSVATPTNLNKEYGLLTYYNSYSNRNKISGLFNFLSSSLESGQWTFLNLNEVQLSVNQHFKYLAIKKRFMELAIEAQGMLDYSNEGFHVENHTFETLDEVQRALANKMFL